MKNHIPTSFQIIIHKCFSLPRKFHLRLSVRAAIKSMARHHFTAILSKLHARMEPALKFVV